MVAGSRSVTNTPLTVLQVLGGMPGWGGAERVALDLGIGLRERGHRVLFASPQEQPLVRFREAGFESVFAPIRSPWLPKPVGALAALMRREGVQIVHCHERRAGMAALPAAMLAGALVRVLHVHSIASMGGSRAAYATAIRLLGRFANRVVFCSEFVQRNLRQRPGAADRVIPNGVVFPPFLPDKRRGPGQELLSVGRLSRAKGLDILLTAVTRVANDAPGLRLSIAGEGELQDELLALRGQLGLDDRVALLGFCGDVSSLMAASDVFVMPSLWEGLPIALLEAVAAGLPVVATAVGAIPEVITNGETGWLVPPGDAEALAGALREALLQPEEARRRAVAAFESANTRYSVDAMVGSFDELYRQLARARGLSV